MFLVSGNIDSGSCIAKGNLGEVDVRGRGFDDEMDACVGCG